MKTYYITSERIREHHSHTMYKGQSELIKFDYSEYAEVNGAITTVTWSVEYGDAALSGKSLASNVAQAQCTTANPGKSLIKVTATDGTDIDIQWLEVYVKDLTVNYTDDYGLM